MEINSADPYQTRSKNSCTLKLPKRRSTRLKSEIFVEAFKTDFLDEEYDATKVSFNSTDHKFEPPKKKTKLSKANSNNSVNEILNSTDPVEKRLVDNATKNKGQTKRGGKVHENIDQMTDRLLKNLTTVIDDKLKVSKQKNEILFENSNSKRRKKQSSVDNNLSNVLNDSADQTSPLQGKRTRRLTKLLDTPPTNNIKVIKIESSRQSIDIKLDVNESHENLTTKIVNNTLKVITPKVGLTKIRNNVMQDNKIIGRKRISKDFSCADKLLEGKVKNPLKITRNSINKPEIVEPADETLHYNNTDIDDINNNDNLNKSAVQAKRLKRMQKDLEISDVSQKELRSKNASDVNNLQEPQAIKKSNAQSKKQALNETFDSSLSAENNLNNKTTSLQPNKRGRPSSSKQRVRKLKPTKISQIHSTKLSKLTKEQLKNVNTRKIPKKNLDDVLDMIDNDDHPAWEDRNISCNPCIHTHWESNPSLTSDQNMKLKLARQFLLRRNWISLSKVLCLSNSSAKTYYPLLSKYAALLLAYTDKDQFAKFVQFLTSITDSSSVLRKCTKISKDKEE